jgi:4-hydroxy-tetrahydrodipicolinate synthase
LQPDPGAFLDLARWLLEGGADGLNVLGTTGEATSLSQDQRRSLMTAAGRSSLPMDRLMVGTGAASLAEAVTLTRTAADAGFAGALILPPFYYKNVPEDGIVRYLDALARETAGNPIPLYLYNFPAMTGLAFSESLVRRLVGLLGERIAGLKDSSGDMNYAHAIARIDARLRVFPSNEAVLSEARTGTFAGCISASANVNAALCAQAFGAGDGKALERAVRIRKLFDGLAFVPAVKAVLAWQRREPSLAAVVPPFVELCGQDAARLAQGVDSIVAET